jgi:TonB family protein
MKYTLVFGFLLCAAFTAQAASTFAPSVQNVRFAQESSASDVVTPPKVLTHPAAVYTDEARKLGIQGNVVVQAYFEDDGNITVLKVVKGLGYGLDENALAALKDWHFAPALRDGLPVSAVAEIEVPFNLPLTNMQMRADSVVLVNGVLHLKGNVEVRITRQDGSVSILKGNEVTYRAGQMRDMQDVTITRNRPQ